MEKCAELMINEPETMRGHWRELMPDCTELHIELGWGKDLGKVEKGYVADLVVINPRSWKPSAVFVDGIQKI